MFRYFKVYIYSIVLKLSFEVIMFVDVLIILYNVCVIIKIQNNISIDIS